MTSSGAPENRMLGLLCGGSVVLLGTVNLWKVQLLQALVPIDLTLLSVLLAAALTLFMLLNRGLALEKSWSPLLVGFALFTPALLATSLGNPYSLSKTQSLFTVCFLSVAAPMVLLRSHERRVWFVRVIAALSVVMAVWLLRGGEALAGSDPGRLQVEGANPIALGRLACLGAVIFALTVLRIHGLPRLAALAGFVLCAVAAVSTGSRGPLAAAVAAVALVSVVTGASRSRAKMVTTLAVFAVGAAEAVSQLAPASALERISSAGGGVSDTARVRLATESLAVAWNNWGGVGWGDLGNYLSAAARSDAQGWAQYPHNIVLEALVEGGVIGLVGLVIMLAVSWRRLRFNASTLTGQILAGLWLLAFGSALTSGDLVGNRLVWMMIGVGLALPTARGAPVPDPADAAVAGGAAPDAKPHHGPVPRRSGVDQAKLGAGPPNEAQAERGSWTERAR